VGTFSEELLFELFGLKLSAHGEIASLMAVPVTIVMRSVAWRIMRGSP
jgi:hypothetical protein